MGGGRGEIKVFVQGVCRGQCVVWCACGLNHLGKTFVVSTAYFDYS